MQLTTCMTGFLLAFSVSVQAQSWTIDGNTNLTTNNNILGNKTTNSTIPVRFYSAGLERMRLEANGWLKIGPPGPAATQALHVYNGNILIDGTGNYGNLFLGNGLGVTASQWGIEYLPPTTLHPGGMNFWKPWLSIDGNGNNGFGNYYLFLRNDGKVGVGTECVPADSKMAVNGKLYAREVEIQTNSWCDSVFEPSYPLMSLDSLQNFIDNKGHLPGMPSEAEVMERGSMAVMEMNLQLLKKVEELHLYVLQLEARLKAAEDALRKEEEQK